MSKDNDTNPLIPLMGMAGVYYFLHTDDTYSENDEYPLVHILLYCGMLYYMREHLGAPEILAIMAPLAASNLARENNMSYTQGTLAGLAALLFVRHMKGDLTVSKAD